MKIGIITFWQSYDNYGQLLQCWALQAQLRKLGHDPFLIRYNYCNYYEHQSIWKLLAKILLIKPYIKQYKKIRESKDYINKNKIREFDLFRKKYLSQSDYYADYNQLISNPPEADAYITGSDQVWAQLINKKCSLPFFLCFGKSEVRRIAYAPSFAMKSYPEELKGMLYNYLIKFDYVSVREQGGVNICNKVGINAEHVLDPTLLLDNNDYKVFLSDRKIDVPYVYIYSINIQNPDEIRWEEVKKTCKERGLRIVATPASGYFKGSELFDGDVMYDYATIPSWLSNISNASMLVTTSFHGVAFALILHCPFIYIPLKGKFSFGNDRVEELLINLGLDVRIMKENMSIDDFFDNDIRWGVVDEMLSSKRIKSLSFLQNSLL